MTQIENVLLQPKKKKNKSNNKLEGENKLCKKPKELRKVISEILNSDYFDLKSKEVECLHRYRVVKTEIVIVISAKHINQGNKDYSLLVFKDIGAI